MVSVYTRNGIAQSDTMPMSKKQLEKNRQKNKAEAAELEKAAASGDKEAKKKLEKLEKKMKKK